MTRLVEIVVVVSFSFSLFISRNIPFGSHAVRGEFSVVGNLLFFGMLSMGYFWLKSYLYNNPVSPMTSADIVLLIKKIAVGIFLTVVPFILIAGGIWLAYILIR